MTDTAAAFKDLYARIDVLIAEKHTLQVENDALKAANERLGEAAKALIAEKGELQHKLAALEGMGAQQNQPGTFKELKDGKS